MMVEFHAQKKIYFNVICDITFFFEIKRLSSAVPHCGNNTEKCVK